MNPQWNTPPNGDFAKYVERLSAQAAMPRRGPAAGEHVLDEGMQPSASTSASASATSVTSPGEVPRRPAGTGVRAAGATIAGGPANPGFVKVIGIAFAVLLLGLLAAGVSIGIVIAVLVGGLWLAQRLRCLLLPVGMESWQQWLESAARAQRAARTDHAAMPAPPPGKPRP